MCSRVKGKLGLKGIENLEKEKKFWRVETPFIVSGFFFLSVKVVSLHVVC